MEQPADPIADPVADPASGDAPPFEKEPFDAGVETDEQSDPKKFIEQLSGKIGQALRSYTEKQGQPDFELEKFAVNSLLSATHTAQMPEEDQNDIIDKVKKADGQEGGDGAGDKGGDEPTPDDNEEPTPEGGEEPTPEDEDMDFTEENVILEKDANMFVEPKKMTMFSDEAGIESKKLKENSVASNKKSIFVNKTQIRLKLQETFNQDTADAPAPAAPITKPSTTPVEPIKPTRKSKPFLPTVHPSIQPKPKAEVEEGGKKKPTFVVYHKSFSEAVQEARSYAEQLGYEVDDDDWFNQVSTGPRKPDEGVTNSYSLRLLKAGGVEKKQLHMQVYGMRTSYELNCYIA